MLVLEMVLMLVLEMVLVMVEKLCDTTDLVDQQLFQADDV